jgi:fimbrial chaperone protein
MVLLELMKVTMKTTVFMNNIARWLCAGVISIAVAQNATAGTFSISPLRIQLDRKHTIDVLTVHNDDDATLMIQAQIVAWSQDGNEEHYADSKDLLVTPPIFQLAPKSDQIVRIALRHIEKSDDELHYRLILTEVPQAAPKNFVGLSVALRMSIPVFITPDVAVHPDVVWTAKWLNDGNVQIEAFNQGKAHLQINDFEAQFGTTADVRANPSRYVLPGSRITWNLKPPANVDHQASIDIHGYSDQGEFRAAIGNAEIH